MSMKASKVLVSGDVNGRFDRLIRRVTNVCEKNGPFDMLICVGEFFGIDVEMNQKVIDGKLEFPITTYVLGPCCPSTSIFYPDDSAELSSSVTFLGKKGILNTATGLQVAYLSGVEGSHSTAFQAWKHSSNEPSREVNGSRLISKLAAGLKPRYHFAGMGIHYERDPYRNHRVLLEAAQHVTRFIGLASVDNSDKEKWLYAFSIVPMRKMSRMELTAQPPNTSEFPYMEIIADLILEERASAEERNTSNGGQQYFFDMSEEVEDHVDRGGRRRKKYDDEGPSARQARVQQPCWFCLSNVDVEKYLVVSVGSHCYAAMPKGPLTDGHL
uniref:Cwf19-like protein C-terminal domain-containing protein n=1 Tax=Parascaris univalens TaxID=6257 RepID=A0A915B4K0_PARUN